MASMKLRVFNPSWDAMAQGFFNPLLTSASTLSFLILPY